MSVILLEKQNEKLKMVLDFRCLFALLSAIGNSENHLLKRLKYPNDREIPKEKSLILAAARWL